MAGQAAASMGAQSPEIISGPPKAEFEPNPHLVGGFLMELEDGSSVAVEVRTLRDEEAYRGGTTCLEAYMITEKTPDDNGEVIELSYLYNVRSNMPAHLRSDTRVWSTTAWTTREGGFNRKVMEGLNDIGYATSFVEPEGKSISASLQDAAKHINYIRAVADQRRGDDKLSTDTAAYIGPSRAAAVGLGVTGLAYSDLSASCFVKPRKLSQLPEDAIQLGVEGWELFKHAVTLSPKELVEHRSTFSFHPVDFMHTVLAIRHLRSGQTGTMLRGNDAGAVNLTLFNKDGWSQHEDTEEEAGNKSNIHTAVLDGRHLSLAHPLVIQAAFDRFDTIAQMRGLDGGFDKVDFETVAGIRPRFDERRSTLGSITGRLGVDKVLRTAQSLASIS